MTKPDHSLLIETDELEARLDDSNLRIVDCNVLLIPNESGGYVVKSGLDDWEVAHIPGAIFVDIEKEVSGDHPHLRFMMPNAEHFAAAMSGRGIGDNNEVVLYSRGANFWATRLFLMFREFGFDNVRVLNGAWDKWLAEGRPTTADQVEFPQAEFTASAARGIFVGKEAVLRGIDNAGTCILNALSPDFHSGEKFNPHYGRPGHIKNSVNSFAFRMIDKHTNAFLPVDKLSRKLDEVGALDAEHVLNYCGGGISATTNAFALLLLGKQNFSVYDGSLLEWGNDESLPMETG